MEISKVSATKSFGCSSQPLLSLDYITLALTLVSLPLAALEHVD